MTDVPAIEGGLDEPAELEPEQGSLRLASPDDQHDAAAWEAATAAVLRKARRLGEDDPDSAVWDKLTRTTLDGIAVAPIGTPRQPGRPRHQRPADPRRRLGHPRRTSAARTRRPPTRPC